MLPALANHHERHPDAVSPISVPIAESCSSYVAMRDENSESSLFDAIFLEMHSLKCELAEAKLQIAHTYENASAPPPLIPPVVPLPVVFTERLEALERRQAHFEKTIVDAPHAIADHDESAFVGCFDFAKRVNEIEKNVAMIKETMKDASTWICSGVDDALQTRVGSIGVKIARDVTSEFNDLIGKLIPPMLTRLGRLERANESPTEVATDITLSADSLSAGPLCDTPSKSVTPPCLCDGHHGWSFTFLCNKDLSCLESVSKSTQSNAAFVVGSFVSGMAIIQQIYDLLVQFFPDAHTLYHLAQIRSSRSNFPQTVSDARYRLAHIFSACIDVAIAAPVAHVQPQLREFLSDIYFQRIQHCMFPLSLLHDLMHEDLETLTG